MTVVRVIRCSTCKKSIIIKIQVPYSDYELFEFSCPNCRETLKYEIRTKEADDNLSKVNNSSSLNSSSHSSGLNAVSNCTDISDEIVDISNIAHLSDFNPIYLSKEIPNNASCFSSFPYSPAPIYLSRMMKEGKSIINKEKVIKGWEYVNRIFCQHSQNNTTFKNSLISEFQENFCGQVEMDFGINNCLFSILHYLISKVEKYNSAIISLVQSVSALNKSKVLSFVNYLRKEFKRMLPSIIEVCNEFFSRYDVFHLFLQNMSDGNNILDLSYPFDSHSGLFHIYGLVYEKFADLIEFYCCFINLEQGRGFDCFENSKTSLESYKQSDKANRIRKSFKKNDAIKILTEEYNPDIRNATLHSKINIDFEKNNLVLQRRESVKELIIPFKEYLNKTSIIFMEFSSLICLWLLVIQHGESLKKIGVYPG